MIALGNNVAWHSSVDGVPINMLNTVDSDVDSLSDSSLERVSVHDGSVDGGVENLNMLVDLLDTSAESGPPPAKRPRLEM